MGLNVTSMMAASHMLQTGALGRKTAVRAKSFSGLHCHKRLIKMQDLFARRFSLSLKTRKSRHLCKAIMQPK